MLQIVGNGADEGKKENRMDTELATSLCDIMTCDDECLRETIVLLEQYLLAIDENTQDEIEFVLWQYHQCIENIEAAKQMIGGGK